MFLIIFGRAAQFVLLLTMMRVATSFLPPEEMGRMSLITTSTAFFALFLVNPVGMFINRRLHAWDSKGLVKHYLNFYWFYLLLVGMAAAGGLLLVNSLGVIGFQTSTIWLLVLVCGSLLFNTVNQTVIPSLNLLGFRGWFIVLTLATIATGFLLALILIMRLQPKAEYWLLGLLLGQLVFAGIGGKVFFGKLHSSQVATYKPTRTHIKVLFGFAWPVAISVGLNWFQTQGYRFLMENSLGLAPLGLFVAGYGISIGMVAAFESVLTTYFQPLFYKRVSAGDREEHSRAWNYYASAILPSLLLLVCFIAAVAPELTRLLLGPAYQSASQFVVWGAVAEATRVAVGTYGMVAHAKMKTKLLLVPNLVGAVLSITLILWLVPEYGPAGAGIALTLAGVAVVVAMHRFMRSELVITLPYKFLIRSLGLGVLLIGVATAGRLMTGESESLMLAVLLLVVVGASFLPIQYWLLRPFLSRHGEVV